MTQPIAADQIYFNVIHFYPTNAGKPLPKFENSLRYDSVPTSLVGATEVACRRERDLGVIIPSVQH